MTGPRVALIRQRYNPAGGAERFVSRVIDVLRRDGVETTLITRKWSANPRTSIVALDPFYVGRTWRDRSFAEAVCRHLRDTRYDLVQSHERLSCCDIYRAGDGVHREWLEQRCRRLGPLDRFMLMANPHHRYLLRAERDLFHSPRLKTVICISRMVKEEIVRHYQVPEDKLVLLYVGIDLDEFHPRQRERLRQRQRQALGIGDDTLALLHVGSGFERKGVDTLLRAVAQASDACHVIVVGSDRHEAKYRALARALGLGSRAHFVGTQKDPKSFYAAADALVMPSLYEPFGNANAEALAMGLPVVTSSKCGAAELLEEGVTGYVRDALDVAGLASAIRALADREHRSAMGVAARRLAERFSLDAVSRELLALYARSIDGPVPRAS